MGWIPIPFLWGSDRTLPLFTPKHPQRVYFYFGHPIHTAGLLRQGQQEEPGHAHTADQQATDEGAMSLDDDDLGDELGGSHVYGLGAASAEEDGVLADAEPFVRSRSHDVRVYEQVRDRCMSAVQDGIQELFRYRDRDPNRMTVDAARNTAVEFLEWTRRAGLRQRRGSASGSGREETGSGAQHRQPLGSQL